MKCEVTSTKDLKFPGTIDDEGRTAICDVIQDERGCDGLACRDCVFGNMDDMELFVRTVNEKVRRIEI